MHTLFIPRVIWNLNPPKRHFYLQDVSLKMYLLGWDDNSVGTVLALQVESLNLIPEPVWKSWIWWHVLVISLLVRRRQADHWVYWPLNLLDKLQASERWCLKKIDSTWWPHTWMHRYTYLQTFGHTCMYVHIHTHKLEYCFSWWHWGFYKLCVGWGQRVLSHWYFETFLSWAFSLKSLVLLLPYSVPRPLPLLLWTIARKAKTLM